jgi:hypothetical protein
MMKDEGDLEARLQLGSVHVDFLTSVQTQERGQGHSLLEPRGISSLANQ